MATHSSILSWRIPWIHLGRQWSIRMWYLHLISASSDFLINGAWESLLSPHKLDMSYSILLLD